MSAHKATLGRQLDLDSALPEPGKVISEGRWFVVQTLAQRENRAEAQLKQQGFDTFLPRVKKTVRHARKQRTVLAAAFPGYLFVRLDLQRDRWRPINGTFGVLHLMMAEEKPIPVPRGVVETIMAYVDETGLARFDHDLVEGQAVRVKIGPLADAVGELVRVDAKGRVRVLLQIMGGKVQATVERSALEAA